jgi:hypothetical protein
MPEEVSEPLVYHSAFALNMFDLIAHIAAFSDPSLPYIYITLVQFVF